MGCSTYFIISLILFSSLVLSPVSAATGELPRPRDGERDSKDPYPGPNPVLYPPCYGINGICPPPTTVPTNP